MTFILTNHVLFLFANLFVLPIGAIHDCTSDSCPCSGSSCQCCPLSDTQCDAGGTYIMNPTNNVSTESFSPCSINTICGLFSSMGSCLEGK